MPHTQLLTRFVFLRFFLLAALAVAAGLTTPVAHALLPMPAMPVRVIEYYNVHLDHYFLTKDHQEMAAIDAGLAGPGWVRTGHAFLAHLGAGGWCEGGCGQDVHRFYGTPGLGPNSHFFTAFPVEAEILKQPGTGWSFERIEFSVHLPDSNGNCGPFTPVYRLYNNRWMFNDSNHRFVADAKERARMVALGWIDEGIAFCSFGALEGPR